jgi:pimeloyl-ACP methyl ester carboxylesterase
MVPLSKSLGELGKGATMSHSFGAFGPAARYADAATLYSTVGGTAFAFRDIGPLGDLPLVLLNHWGAVLDKFDQSIVADHQGGPIRHRRELGHIRISVLVANGDNDVMVPTPNSRDMARCIPGAELVIHDDAGHGGIFQHQAAFVPKALAFLEA